MQINAVVLKMKQKEFKVTSSTTREQLIRLVGTPDDIGGFSSKRKRGAILKYDETEFHFTGDKDEDHLRLIYREQKVGDDYVPEISIKLNPSTI